jgi:alkyl hydroperoxide reductase subunit AhpC
MSQPDVFWNGLRVFSHYYSHYFMLKLNSLAPDFQNITAYQNGAFKKISLQDFRGDWLVFFFYPRDFTFICPTELKGFANAEAEFLKLGCRILAASTDSEWSHKNWFEKDLQEVRYPVMADTTLAVAKAYEVLDETNGNAQRGLFILDPEGRIRYALVSDGSVGRSVKETLRVLQALQTGERCPVEWEKGEATLGK